MKKRNIRRLFRSVNNFLVFFLLVSFVVTCCMLLFLATLAKDLGIVFTEQTIAGAAKITFLNVLLLTLLFAVIDFVRRKLTVDRPVKRITEATARITQGDFSVRIPLLKGGESTDGFNEIIRSINTMTQELSGIETLRTDFIANVSHELKTPLAVIGNYAALLRQPGVTEAEKAEYAGLISDTAHKLAQLVTNILKLNKLENQQIFPQLQEFDVTEQLCRSLLQFENLWEQKNIDIETQLEEPVLIRSDPELLSLVWNNLISNALKFTPEGGTVRVSLTAEIGRVLVTISDTGCGMTPQVGQHIFEKFYQGDPSHSSLGNGLGLALVKRVADILNAEIRVESAAGKGSTFTVILGRTENGLEKVR